MKDNNKDGFTLIELLVVIGIIAILAAVAFPAYRSYSAQAEVTKMMATMNGYMNRALVYYNENGVMPNAADLGIANTGNGVTIDLNALDLDPRITGLGINHSDPNFLPESCASVLVSMQTSTPSCNITIYGVDRTSDLDGRALVEQLCVVSFGSDPECVPTGCTHDDIGATYGAAIQAILDSGCPDN
jgi:prepilin-type N-terminal cleavage/methylation domain-containing protein